MSTDNWVFVVVQIDDGNGVSIVCTVTTTYRKAWDHVFHASEYMRKEQGYRVDYYNSLPTPDQYRAKEFESIIGSWCIKTPRNTTLTYQIWREKVNDA